MAKKRKEIEPVGDWFEFEKTLNISPEQKAEIQFEMDIIRATVEARKKNNLTQAELSEKTGIKQSVIARLEKNGNSPQTNTLIRLLLPLGYTIRVVPISEYSNM